MKYTKKDLKKIMEQSINCNLDDSYEELIGIKDKLYKACSFLDKFDVNDMGLNFVKTTIDYLLHGKYVNVVDDVLLDFLTYDLVLNYDKRNALVERIETIFEPEKFYNKSLVDYCFNIRKIIDIIIWNEWHDISFEYDRFNKFFQTVNTVNNINGFRFTIDYKTMIYLLSYCYINDNDYSIAYDFVNNREKYLDYFMLNGINLSEYTNGETELMFQIIPIIFKKKVKIIK